MLGISPELKPRVDPEAKRFYPIDGPLKLKVISKQNNIHVEQLPRIRR